MIFFRINRLYEVGWEPVLFLSTIITSPPTILYLVHIRDDGMLAKWQLIITARLVVIQSFHCNLNKKILVWFQPPHISHSKHFSSYASDNTYDITPEFFPYQMTQCPATWFSQQDRKWMYKIPMKHAGIFTSWFLHLISILILKILCTCSEGNTCSRQLTSSQLLPDDDLDPDDGCWLCCLFFKETWFKVSLVN